MRCDLSLFAAGVACFAPLASAWGPGGEWGSSTPSFTTPNWGSTTTWGSPTTWGTAAAPTGGWGAHNTSGPWATGGTTAVPTHKTWHSAPVPASPTTWATPEASSTGGAAAMATSFAGLVVAGGLAVLAL